MINPKFITLNLVKDNNGNNTDESATLVKYIKNSNNLRKILNTRKILNKKNYIPYLSYIKNNKEYKLYNYNDIDKFLNTIIYKPSTELLYNSMMETPL